MFLVEAPAVLTAECPAGWTSVSLSLYDFVSGVLLKVKSLASVVLGKEPNKDVVFVVLISCFTGLREENQEEDVWLPAVVSLRGVNSKSDPVVFCADTGEDIELERDEAPILVSDLGKPKNDLDALASVPTPGISIDRAAGDEVMLSFSVVSSTLIEGDRFVIASASWALRGGDNFGFLCLIVSCSDGCERVRAVDFPREKHLCGSIVRDDLCLRDAECDGVRHSPVRTYVSLKAC